ncbi:MAG TPA: TonB-dependent receptor [Bryobacteraceae bacterium]|nr:TonB-dependent receptor [Bryobacteraceae bacterium]
MYAQQSTATLTGIVTDPSGAAIPGASVRLENVSRGVARAAATGTDGRFLFDFVAVGTYQLTVSQSGFNNAVHPGLELTTGQVLDVPVQMQVQQQSQTVEVQAETAELATSSVEQVATVSVLQIKELPVAHLDWTNLLSLSPGATRPPQGITINSTSPVGSGVNINGLPSAGYNFTVDGTNASNNMEFTAFNFYQAAGLINAVNNDAIEEVSTVKGVPASTVGGGMSGNINIVTKGGNNGYHGSVHEINEVSLFDARNQFLTSKPRTTFNDYGVSLGLPIIKNRLFFFGSFEAAALSATKAITGGVPSPYLLSIAPAVYQPLLKLFPRAPQPSNATATTSQFFGAASNLQKDDNGVYRLDYYLNTNNIVAFRWIRSRPYVVSPALLPANPRHYFDNGSELNATYTHSSLHWTENSRFAFNHVNMNRVDDLLTDPTFVNMSFGWSSAGSKLLNWYGNYTTFQEAVSYVHGIQTIQFGGIFERGVANELQIAPVFILYSNVAQFLANTPSTFQLELHSLPAGQPYFIHVTDQIGEYFQDDVRLSSNLTLNLGVRYDVWTVPGESGSNRVFNRDVDPARPGLMGGFGPIINYFYKPDHTQIQPRIGLAYNLFGAGRTVFRAGFGKLSMGHTLYSGVTQTYQLGPAIPFQYTLNQAQTTASGLKYPYDSSGYVQDLTRLQTAGAISTNLPVTQAINTHFPDPYSLQWMFGIQQALPWGLTLEADYNGNRGLHEQFNEVLNKAGRLTGVPAAPNFGGVPFVTVDDRSKYAALQTTLRKRLEKGLAFSVGFNYSRVSSFSDADNLLQTAPQDPYNFHTEWGPAPFDINRRFVANAIWDVPFTKLLHSSSRAANLLLGGWQVSGVFSAQSGMPANITDSASANSVDRPDAAANGISPYFDGYQTGLHQYLNTAAFTQIPISALSGEQIRPGNLSRNAIRVPGLENLDATLAKSLQLTERFRMQLRADTFNTLNHTNLSGLVTQINNSTFGRLTQATARTMQLGARVTF